ncbi:MAG TPA: ABC transporter ATP-binding protein [Candidatus Rubrimentiphilum sp.]|nr:ABC transporter ATP-binding protein [Candidatus Rubrimentiphilum sp.]
MTGVSLARPVQNEFSHDLKRTVLALARGRYRPPGRRLVLRDVNVATVSGERVGVIGANGSGKSTLLKLIAGILTPTAGSVQTCGLLAPLVELGAGFDPELSVQDNVVLYGVLLGYPRARMAGRIEEILEFAELQQYRWAPVKTLSSGMTARLGFAIATDVDPDILLLDEVLAIGDEQFRRKCKERLDRFWHGQTTVMVVSHDLAFIEQSCDRVLCIDRGRIAFDGVPRTAIRFYLDAINLPLESPA